MLVLGTAILFGSGAAMVSEENSGRVRGVQPHETAVPASSALAPDAAVRAEACKTARSGLRWYVRWFSYWRSKTGAADGRSHPRSRSEGIIAQPRTSACPRYLAKVFRAKAHAARKAYAHWRWYHYAWWDWLPMNWQLLGACETGYGRRPGNWEHTNSRFTSAFGISWAEYDANSAYMGGPPWHVRHTPRDQYNAALGHLARFGDGWTCPGP